MKQFKDRAKILNKTNISKEQESDDEVLRQIIIKDEKGNIKEGKIIFSFTENGDEYVIYQLDEQAFAAKIDENNDLYAIDDDEWPLVEKIYNQYCEENKDDNEEA